MTKREKKIMEIAVEIDRLLTDGIEIHPKSPIHEKLNKALRQPLVSGSLPHISEIETAALLHEEKNSNNFKMSASDDFKSGVEWLKLKLFSGGNDR